jgi:hypothetical protein
MPRYNSYAIANPHAFVAGGTSRVDLPRSGFICQLDHLLNVNLTTAAAATVLEDAFYRLIKATRILAAGSKTFFSHGDARLWYYWMLHRCLGALHQDTLPTAAGGPANYQAYLPLHLGFDPLNIFDGKVVIPGRDLQNLTEEVVWGTSADIGANQTVNAAAATYLQMIINEVALEPGETVASYFPAGFLLPRFEYRSTPLAVQSNLGVEDDVPVGDMLFHSLVMILAAAGTKSDADASEIGVKFPKVRETPMQIPWPLATKQARYIFSLPATLTGVILLPWERISRDPLGLDLKLAQAGDVKLAITTLLGTGLWERLHYCLG